MIRDEKASSYHLTTMRCRRSRTLLCATIPVLVASVLALAACPSPPVRPVRDYRVPSAFSGWLLVKYSVPGAPPLEHRDGRLVIHVPERGVVETSSPVGDGVIGADRVYLMFPDGHHVLVPYVGRPNPPYDEPVYCCRTNRTVKHDGEPVVYEWIWLGTDGDCWKRPPGPPAR